MPKSYHEQKYPYRLRVKSTFSGDSNVHKDVIKGLNRGHALSRGKWNWPNAKVEEVFKMPKGKPLSKLKAIETKLGKASKIAGKFGKGLGKLSIVGNVLSVLDEASKMKRKEKLKKKFRENKPFTL